MLLHPPAMARPVVRLRSHVLLDPSCRRLILARFLHSATQTKSVAASSLVAQVDVDPVDPTATTPTATRSSHHMSALAMLPLTNVIRTLAVTSITSSPALMTVCLAALKTVVSSPWPILRVDGNRLLRWFVQHTFYPQFCAGESMPDVRRSLANVRHMGFDGVILESSLEIVASQLEEPTTVQDDTPESIGHIDTWRQAMVDSINMTGPGDFLGIKWSGLGPAAFARLRQNAPPSPAMAAAMHHVCNLAESRGVRLLPSAEEDATNVGIDAWSLDLQKIYNRSDRPNRSSHLGPDQALVFTTYQLYLKSTPAKISRHLADAVGAGYVLGIKLVRGAYMATESRDKIWSTKQTTDQVYDSVVEGLLRQKYNSILTPVTATTDFPPINLFIASHNRQSVERAQAIRNEQSRAAGGSSGLPDLYYAQLYGMADEISCDLAHSARDARRQLADATKKAATAGVVATGHIGVDDVPKTVKCIAWGSPADCLQYLSRRAAENKEAATRTIDTRNAMRSELWRRLRWG